MNKHRRDLLLHLGAIGLGSTSLTQRAFAQADGFPSKPMKVILGFPAGGALDLIARAIAQRWGERLGQPMVVENRPGAGGTIATAAVAKSPPDGYTTLFVSPAHAVNVSMYRSLPYDTEADFEPIGMASITTPVLVVNPSLGVKSVSELIAMAKAKPGNLNIASSGVGSSSHLSSEIFKSMAGVNVVHVPFKGTVDALRDLVAGQVHMSIDSITALLPFIKDGRLVALGVGSTVRSPLLPDVPTIDEAGLKGFSVFAWAGFLAPAKTPRPVVDKLNAALNAVLQMPELRVQLAQMATVPRGGTPDEFKRLINGEVKRFAQVIASAGIPIQQ